LGQAAALYAELTATKRAAAGMWFEYGSVLLGLDDSASALVAFDEALRREPQRATGWNDRGTALISLGQAMQARASFERALRLNPKLRQARANLANLQHQQGELVEAEAAYRLLLEQDAEDTLARVGLGRLLWEMGNAPSALTELTQALERAPGSYQALVALVTARCHQHDWHGALQDCAAFSALLPLHSGGLALQAELEFEVGAREQMTPTEYDRLLKTYTLAAPDSELNLDLAAAISKLRSLILAPPHHATRNGQHSGALFGGTHRPFQRLEEALATAVGDYWKEVGAGSDALSERRPSAVTINAWAVLLQGDGFQLPHVHPEAWVSGVYYVEVPASCGGVANADREGCLELGQVDPSLGLVRQRTSHFVTPVAGKLVLFPSCLFHSTIPHRMPGRRISVGIDVIPLR